MDLLNYRLRGQFELSAKSLNFWYCISQIFKTGEGVAVAVILWARVLRVRLWEKLSSGWGTLWELSSFVPWLVPYVFRDVSGAVPDRPWIGGFLRRSSKQDSASKMRLSVLLNSYDTFFAFLPSIQLEALVLYSCCDLETFEFCAELFLGCSSQFSLLSVASFLLFLRDATFYGKSSDQRLKIDSFFAEGKWIWVLFNSVE